MSDNPDKNTVGSDHLRPLKAAVDGLQKTVDAARKKNKDDPNAIDLGRQMKALATAFDAMEPGKTQMSAYEELKTKVKTSLTEFPKLAKEVKEPTAAAAEASAEIKVVYGSDKVKKACNADSHCAARIDEVANHGKDYKGHKAVTAIKAQGHVHVGNKNGIAFSWKNDTTLVIDAYGTKNDKAKPGNSGYDWII